ncbi:MAG: hypothetical protein PHS88_01660, partial [Candidatus Omnitrophica bacterium]|nr:hypothetical protein [Candidatus Omnitrophota bacterium]
ESNQEHPFQRVLDLWRVGPEGVKALYEAQARIDDLNQRVKARKGFIRYNNERRAFNTSCISFLLAQVGVYEYVDYAGGGKIG